jgi:cell division protein FtsQ
VTIESISRNRPPAWEDEAAVEPRLRRVQQGVPPSGRALPGMPLEMTDPEDDDDPRPGGRRFGSSRQEKPRSPWYRPASTVGRVFLALVAVIVLGGLGTSVYLFKTFLSRDSRFRIAGTSNIEATGLTEVSRAQMLPVFGEDVGRNIFFVPLNERRKELEEIPWIERATVMRLLPDRIRVSVVERQPVAFVRQGQQIGLVDANGVLLTMPAALMAQHNYSFPVVTGISARDPLAERKARMAVYQRLLAELDSNGQRISEQISEIDLSDTEDLQVVMPEQGGDILLHFGEDRFLERYQHYKAHIAEWRQQFPKLTGVDLRLDPKFVLQMAAGTDVAQDATAASDSNSSNSQLAANAQTATQATDQQPTVAKPAASQPQSVAKATPGKPESKSSTAAKSAAAQKKARAQKAAAAKAKAALLSKKRAEAKRAALILNRQKTAPTAPPATLAGQGQ